MKKLLLFLPLLISVLFVNAQFGTPNPLTILAYFPSSVYSCDLDGDGDIDVLSASLGDDKIAWYENLGGGIFEDQKVISINADGANFVYAADIDNDGDMDVLSASPHDFKIAWYENLGGGIIDTNQQIIAYLQPTSIYVTDIDNDGDIDVLSASFGSNKIAWYENLGNATFGSQQIITNNADGVESVYAADVDGDGDNDILSASYLDDKIAWYQNLGGGAIDTNQNIIATFNRASKVLAKDLDNDGDIDILSASSIDNKIVWYQNLGGGIIDTTQHLISSLVDQVNIYTEDLDNDGDFDVISASKFDYKIAWYENLGGGIIDTNQQIISIIANYLESVHTADIDNDGNIDILSAGPEISWYKNLGSGIFSMPKNITSSIRVAAGDQGSLFSVDIDNDGDIDILFTPNDNPKIAWYENRGEGKFGTEELVATLTEYPKSFYPEDLDNDGDIDVIVALCNSDKIVWYQNLGSGSFGTEQIISNLTDYPTSVYAKDLDNDGDMDVLSASAIDNKIAWYQNLGGGTIDTNQQIISTLVNNPQFVYAEDIDSDGDIDVFSASFGDDKVAWYENIGGGNFGIQQVISTQINNAKIVYTNDLDGDGDMDVLSVGYGNIIIWHENLGGGIIDTTAHLITSINTSITNAFINDVNGDGLNDIIALNVDSNSIEWYKNLGGGNFDSQKTLSNNGLYIEVADMGDLDNDGDLDLISIYNNIYNKLAWYENFYGSPYKLIGDVFYDGNQNKLKDTNEIGLSFVPVSLVPNNAYSFTNDGYYSFTSDSGTYTVNQSFSNALWDLTTDSSSYTKTLTGSNPIADSLDFGFYPNTITTIIEPELTGGFPRCNTIINYWVNIRNEGTTMPNGIVHLQLDDSVSYVSSINPPDSIVGQNIYWHFDSLFFFSEEMINLQVQMPPFTSMGDTLISILNVYELDGSNNIVYSNTNTLNQVLVCAYDPNDKTVLPKGIGSQGFIANNQPLEYLIRFQNTGNDTALTVMVRDQLDDNLDWASLKPLASSHPMQVWIEQDGEAVFKFNNIMLPDSNVDFLGSQGFVKFSINQKPNLAPNTPIFNTGHIYFDFNPAVITNTVLNTIEDTTSFPVAVQEIAFTETNEIIVFPNPFTEHITIYYKANINTTYHVSLYDMSGKEIMKKENNTSNKTELDVSQLKNGIYIIVGTDTNGKKLFSEQIVAQ